MKTLLFTAFAVIIFTGQTTLAQAAPFRGYYAIEQTLGERMLQNGALLPLDQYTSDQGLLFLLGYWDNQLSPRAFRNGQANALNMLIWYTGLSGLADDIAADCLLPRKLSLNEAFAKVLTATCAQPLDEDAMMAFWLALMGYDAPEDEYLAWRNFLLQNYSARPKGETVKAMALALFMNPYFLVND